MCSSDPLLLPVLALLRRELRQSADVQLGVLVDSSATCASTTAPKSFASEPAVGEAVAVFCSCPGAVCNYVSHIVVTDSTELDADPPEDAVEVDGRKLGRGDCRIQISKTHEPRVGGAGIFNPTEDAIYMRVAELAVCKVLPDHGAVKVSVQAPLPSHAEDRSNMAAAIALATYSYLTGKKSDVANVVLIGGLQLTDDDSIVFAGVNNLEFKLNNAFKYGYSTVVFPLDQERKYKKTDLYKSMDIAEKDAREFIMCADFDCIIANALVE